MIQELSIDLPLELLAAASDAWPAPDWPGWLRYDTPLERKSTCRDWQAMPRPCRELLALLALGLPGLGMLPDLTLHGGGMHSMGAGDHLDVHLDADRHPLTGLARRFNAILFLSRDWRSEWGGHFELWAPDLTHVLDRKPPRFGRVIGFWTNDQSFHGVSPITSPAGQVRKTLALYWWGLPTGCSKRPRAQFVAVAGEQDPEKERLRRERCLTGVHT